MLTSRRPPLYGAPATVTKCRSEAIPEGVCVNPSLERQRELEREEQAERERLYRLRLAADRLERESYILIDPYLLAGMPLDPTISGQRLRRHNQVQ